MTLVTETKELIDIFTSFSTRAFAIQRRLTDLLLSEFKTAIEEYCKEFNLSIYYNDKTGVKSISLLNPKSNSNSPVMNFSIREDDYLFSDSNSFYELLLIATGYSLNFKSTHMNLLEWEPVNPTEFKSLSVESFNFQQSVIRYLNATENKLQTKKLFKLFDSTLDTVASNTSNHFNFRCYYDSVIQDYVFEYLNPFNTIA